MFNVFDGVGLFETLGILRCSPEHEYLELVPSSTGYGETFQVRVGLTAEYGVVDFAWRSLTLHELFSTNSSCETSAWRKMQVNDKQETTASDAQTSIYKSSEHSDQAGIRSSKPFRSW